jgi:CDP-6-deoxy-D-xylo-4-hexulose-3-dehydrase
MDFSKERAEILQKVREYSKAAHTANRPAWEQNTEFHPGIDTVPYAGRVFTEDEVEAAVGATLDFWLTLGKEGAAFEKELATFLGVKHSVLVNSGSSANLLAVTALTTHKLPKERRLRQGDEVITVAAGFPTTLAPIVQNGAVPVLLDNDPRTGNLRPGQLEAAFVEGKTKAVILAHALGNPFNLGEVLEFCHAHNLWLIEDNCDALGCSYSMSEEKARGLGLKHLLEQAEAGTNPNIRFETLGGQRLLTAPTGVWGDLSTQSFYPPHHLTMGEGGAVNIVSRAALKTYVESFRDWGRDCWCASGKDDTCHKRFDWQLGELPRGYDHKYIYSHIGYNLKPLDIQAAIGRAQLRKLPAFIEARKRNWEYLRRGLADLGEYLDFTLPTHATCWNPPTAPNGAGGTASDFAWDGSGCRANCSWFGFMLLVKPGAPFTRTDLARHLDKCKIGNRMLFGGNLMRQPAFVELRKERPDAIRAAGPLDGADRIMNDALFIGVYPGLTKPMLDYMIDVIARFCKTR